MPCRPRQLAADHDLQHVEHLRDQPRGEDVELVPGLERLLEGCHVKDWHFLWRRMVQQDPGPDDWLVVMSFRRRNRRWLGHHESRGVGQWLEHDGCFSEKLAGLYYCLPWADNGLHALAERHCNARLHANVISPTSFGDR